MNGEISKFEEIEYVEDLQEFISVSDDVTINEELKSKIFNTPKHELMKVIKIIGSHVKIESAEVYNEDFLLNNF